MFGSREKCTACNKTVYATERISVDGIVLHQACLRCAKCNNTLKLGNYAALEGKIYCKPHFKELFKLKGKYDFGGKGAADQPTEEAGAPPAEVAPVEETAAPVAEEVAVTEVVAEEAVTEAVAELSLEGTTAAPAEEDQVDVVAEAEAEAVAEVAPAEEAVAATEVEAQ